MLRIPLPGGGSVGISLHHPADPGGNRFYDPHKGLPIRSFPDMVVALTGKDDNNSLSTFQTLIVSTATRVGMGNLVGVVAGSIVPEAQELSSGCGHGTDRIVNCIHRGNACTDA